MLFRCIRIVRFLRLHISSIVGVIALLWYCVGYCTWHVSYCNVIVLLEYDVTVLQCHHISVRALHCYCGIILLYYYIIVI